ncbi:MAG: DUF3530 family protein [Hydrogenophilales bacterium]|nr:DUF3530 family protein [Hydrogenophilales bacterium]
MRALISILSLFICLNALAAADYDREKKWADEILPSVLTGDPVYLEQADGHKFLSLYTQADKARTAVILVHGIGVHPDWGLIGALRQRLADAGHTTLSVQMPVLKAGAKGDDYVPSFDLAAQRLQQSVAWLKGKGYGRIALVSHSLGCRMTYRYLSGSPDPSVAVPRWPPQTAPLMAGQTAPGRTVGLCLLRGDGDTCGGLLEAVASAFEFKH